jgi:hypothetical protein
MTQDDALNALGLHVRDFVEFFDTTTHTLPIDAFKVLYQKGDLWDPHPPSPYKKKVDPFEKKIVPDDVKRGEIQPTVSQRVNELQPLLKLNRFFPTKPTGKYAGYTPTFCVVLGAYTIPIDGIQKADPRVVANLFFDTYPSACAPPGWTLGKPLDADVHPDAKTALQRTLAEYVVGTRTWTSLASRVYVVEHGATSRIKDLGRDLDRFPCANPLPNIALFKIQESTNPVAVYVRTPFVGPVKDSSKERTAYDALTSAKIDSEESRRALNAAKLALVQASTPPVLLLDVVNVTGPIFTPESPEFKMLLDANWIRTRLDHCFDAIFFVAEQERKQTIVLAMFGQADVFPGKSYETYFQESLLAAMKLHPDVDVHFIGAMAGTIPATFPDVFTAQPDALFVNDMGRYVVGNCNHGDTYSNEYFGGHSAMAFLTVPAINPRIVVRTITSTPRTYPSVPARVEVAPPPPFVVSDQHDYVVVHAATLKELALLGDQRAQAGFVPCGGVLEHEGYHQAFVRLRIDHSTMWRTFEQSNHRIRLREKIEKI